MKLTKQVVAFAFAAVMLWSCKGTDFKKTKEGFPYKVYSDGKGEKIVLGNVVKYHLTQKLKDSLLGTTYGGPAKFIPIAKEGEQNPLAKLLIEARKGDSILVLQAVDSLLKSNPQLAQDPAFANKKGEQLKTYIKVVDVYKDNEAAQADFEKENIASFNKDPNMIGQKRKDEAQIEAYLKTNNIQTRRTPWGAYVQTVTPGNGQKAKMGQFVMLRYTGKDMNGTIFDTNNKPGGQLMPMQIGTGGTIIGFEDGVKQLSKGEKAIVYIPSVLGYGGQGSPPKIQPNQNLLFEIELADISDKAPAPPTVPQPDTSRKK